MVERYAQSGTESQGGGGRAACLEFPDAIHDTGSEADGPCCASTLECLREPLAQTVEHLPFKQGVPGSSPGRLTPTVELCLLLGGVRWLVGGGLEHQLLVQEPRLESATDQVAEVPCEA